METVRAEVIMAPKPTSAALLVPEDPKGPLVVHRSGSVQDDGTEGFERSGSHVIDLSQDLMLMFFRFMLDNIERTQEDQRSE